jgi:hypothetical protein
MFMAVRDLQKHDRLAFDDNFDHEATEGSASPGYA